MKTNLLDKQLYNANFQVVGEQLIAWKDARPDNKTFDNLIKCVTEMYFYTNNLGMRNITLDTLLDKQRDENFKLREKLQALTR